MCRSYISLQSASARRVRRALAVAVVCAALIGCTSPPDLQGRVAKADSTSPWPTLFTTAQLAQSVTPALTGANTGTQATAILAARAAALRARARGLSAPVLDSASRKRLLAAVARHP